MGRYEYEYEVTRSGVHKDGIGISDKKARKRLAAKEDLKLGLGAILALINEMMGLSFSLKERTFEVQRTAGGDGFCINKTGFELLRHFPWEGGRVPPQNSGVGIIPWKGNKKFVICVENGEGEIDYLSKPIKGRTRTCCRVLAVITEIELMGLPYGKD